jgi:hypothetical protein
MKSEPNRSQQRTTTMDFNAMFPARFLKSGDLEDGPMQVTIASVKPEEINGERKVVANFSDSKKQMVINRTNARLIAKMYGNDTRNWLGKTITLVVTEVPFKDDLVSAIRVKVTKASTKQEPPPVESPDEFNDEIDPL